MRKFPPTDERHLQAAVGWFELGNWEEANEELENICPPLRAHPDVLRIRVKIYVKAGKWDGVIAVAGTLSKLLPDSSFGVLHSSFARRQLKQLQEAKAELLVAVTQFPKDWRLLYSLSCVYGQLGEKTHALAWLEKAIDHSGNTDKREIFDGSQEFHVGRFAQLAGSQKIPRRGSN